jgi:hypothetical protein
MVDQTNHTPATQRQGAPTARRRAGWRGSGWVQAPRPLATLVAAGTALLLAVLSSGGAAAGTYWVQYPFARDSIPIYNKTGVAAALTAAERWEVNTQLTTYGVSSEPASGITIQWNSSRAGTSTLGWAKGVTTTVGGRTATTDCVVNVNTNVAGQGKPYGKWLEAIVAHETGHCLGWHRHIDDKYSASIMRYAVSKSTSLAGQRYRPSAWDLSQMHGAYIRN